MLCVDLVVGMACMVVDRMQGLAEQMNGEAGLLQRGKQPRPLEDGNWVCDDPSCGNVNYPRRTEVSRMSPNWNGNSIVRVMRNHSRFRFCGNWMHAASVADGPVGMNIKAGTLLQFKGCMPAAA